jgi:hypothetical protein
MTTYVMPPDTEGKFDRGADRLGLGVAVDSTSAEESQITLWFITGIYEDLIAHWDQHQEQCKRMNHNDPRTQVF